MSNYCTQKRGGGERRSVLREVGAWLEKPVFTPWQLFVASQRVGFWLYVAITDPPAQKIRNVVYHDTVNLSMVMKL